MILVFGLSVNNDREFAFVACVLRWMNGGCWGIAMWIDRPTWWSYVRTYVVHGVLAGCGRYVFGNFNPNNHQRHNNCRSHV